MTEEGVVGGAVPTGSFSYAAIAGSGGFAARGVGGGSGGGDFRGCHESEGKKLGFF